MLIQRIYWYRYFQWVDKRKETNNKEYEVNLEAKEWLKFKTRDEIINALNEISKEICKL